MKLAKRLISGVLSLTMACSLLLAGLPQGRAAAPAAGAEQSAGVTGSIGLSVRFDLPQTAANAAGRGIRLQVSRGGQRTVVALPGGAVLENGLGAEVSLSVKNVDGAPLTTEEQVGSYQVELSGLSAGGARYEVDLTGTGYAPFRQTVTLNGYSQHILAGTADAFLLGDVNGDGAVNDSDLSAVTAQLDKASPAHDLNGDGQVDVTDLAYVNYTRGAAVKAQVLDTAAITAAQLDAGSLVLSGGGAGDLFAGERAITVAPAAGGALSPPITVGGDSGVEMSAIRITCPDGMGAVQAGTAQVELAGGAVETVPFGAVLPEGVHAVGQEAGRRVLTIDLGRRVAVKKVTIQVTATAGSTDYATVTKIEFLKDIVPDNARTDADQVKGVTAAAGDGRVSLGWNAVNNVTGYTVAYGLSAGALTKTASVNTNRAEITGLDNLKTYYFQVTAVNGSWRGTPSKVASAVPQPGGVPGAPSNLSVTASDQSLRVGWGGVKDASYYQLFYREAGKAEFTQFGGNLSAAGATITGLVNGTRYEVAVKAGNARGTGPYSATASGTPQREELAMPDLPREDRIDNSMVQSVVMENPANVNRSLCPNFQTSHVIDNDAATYWVANQWWVSSRFTYTFKEPQDMNYAILVPYLGGNHKYALNTYTITAKNSAGEVILPQTLYSAKPMDPNKNYLALTFPLLKGVKELSITLNEREGNGCRVSVSEMAFYRGDSLAEEIAALFTDGSFTAVKPGVTAASVAALSQRLEARADFYLDLTRLKDELALAGALLNQDSSALGLVKSNFQSRGSGRDSAYGQGASDLQPLGVSARAGATVAVYACLPGDEPVYVVPTQFYGESGVWRGGAIRLVNGRNYITVPKIGALTDERGGPLYLTYAGSRPEAVKIQVRGDGNTFTVPVLELSGWYDMGESARREAISRYVSQLQTYAAALGTGSGLGADVRNVTEISTPSVLLSIPASQALSGLKGIGGSAEAMAETMYQDVLAWEDELYVANQVQGIVPAGGARPDSYRYPMTTRQNIRYMRMFAGAFMYAAGNHIGVGYGSTAGLMSGKPVSYTGQGEPNGLFGWGIAHEIGHNMDKLGKAEITNNIYALAVQAWDGSSMLQNTRLTNSNIWQSIRAKTAEGRPGSAGNVFVQLGMYWQLHLAYDGAGQPLDFYNRFFTQWKSGAYAGRSYDERVALIASDVAGRDLSQFFTRWGLTLSQEVRNALAAHPQEPRAVWYLDDGSYAYRLAGGRAFGGTVSLSVSVQENKAVLTVQGGDSSILGYEVRRNGTAIGFTAGNSYTDDLGAANNLTYTYSVVPVDKLGNVGREAFAGEVRVAYDKTISPSLYRVDRSGGETAVTMTGGAVQVTGLKVTGGELSGCTVRIKGPDAAEWRQAALGPVSGGLAYFTKPGAAPGDTRIWTYDAAEISITGLPAGAQVELLDYPGDRIDFNGGAHVGRLERPYYYAGGMIPAGALVIVGTYRGDPVYNTVEIQARYNTTAEAQEENGVTQVERNMNGYALLFAEIPADGAVSDISDGFWIFVPDLEAEKALNAQAGVTGEGPMELRAVLRRTDDPNSSASARVTSQTLWTSFPELETLPQIALTGEGVQQ